MEVTDRTNLPKQDGYIGVKVGAFDYKVFLVDDGIRTTNLPHKKHHSEEMRWGYLGSGAADLARSILADAVGENIFNHPEIYQPFKHQYVARFDDVWSLSKAEVLAWMKQYFPNYKIS
jgi:hypothetical protein